MCGFRRHSLICVGPRRRGFSAHFTPFIGRQGIVNVVSRLDRTRLRVKRGIGPGVIFFSFSLGVVILLGGWGLEVRRWGVARPRNVCFLILGFRFSVGARL